jgi:hypothetical protein
MKDFLFEAAFQCVHAPFRCHWSTLDFVYPKRRFEDGAATSERMPLGSCGPYSDAWGLPSAWPGALAASSRKRSVKLRNAAMTQLQQRVRAFRAASRHE